MKVMTVWFRIGKHIMFFCYKNPLMTVSRQLKFRKRYAFLLVPIWYANAENKYQEDLSHHDDGINRFRENFLDIGLEI